MNYLYQLGCMKQVVSETGEISYVFSLDILLANAIPFAIGFCLFYFWLNGLIFGKSKKVEDKVSKEKTIKEI